LTTLFIIPARGGSKGIVGKNVKPFAGKPLICHAIDIARQFTSDDNICVSTDDDKIMDTVINYGLAVPFKRPDYLATDTASTNDVLLHALNFYAAQGQHYDQLVLLQPTSPFRNSQHVKEALFLFQPTIDMVVSVKETEANPYYVLFEENAQGYLEASKKLSSTVTRRQDAPKVYEYNGAVYIINVVAFREREKLSNFSIIQKYEMDALHSLDLDTPLDWAYAEFLLEKGYLTMGE
jgi:CMP-N,N'-diacetyllegionaminic acid synthase